MAVKTLPSAYTWRLLSRHFHEGRRLKPPKPANRND